MGNPAPHYSYMTIIARTASEPEGIAGSVRDLVWQIEPNAPVSDVITLEQVAARLLSRSTVPALLLVFFAAVALTLAMGGIYGVMSYAVAVRSPEFGIRMALGARPRSIFQMTLLDGFRLTTEGVIAGLVGATLVTKTISNLLYGVEARDTMTFVAVALLLALVSVAACLVPALRAARVNPNESLRLL
jgi:ABC-type antimicrobial peptide transport system permease subunit